MIGAKKIQKLNTNFTKVKIGLSSPEVILQRSHGEVIKPEVRRIYVLMNKPKGTITTSTIFRTSSSTLA